MVAHTMNLPPETRFATARFGRLSHTPARDAGKKATGREFETETLPLTAGHQRDFNRLVTLFRYHYSAASPSLPLIRQGQPDARGQHHRGCGTDWQQETRSLMFCLIQPSSLPMPAKTPPTAAAAIAPVISWLIRPSSERMAMMGPLRTQIRSGHAYPL
jgi:hypothetical protein